MNDLDEIKAQLGALTSAVEALRGVQNLLILKVETRIPLADGFDDRISRVEGLTKSLANTALKLAGARMLTSWVPGAIAGAVAGAVVAVGMLTLLGGVAMAH